MKTLALETSAKSVSVAVTENGTLLAQAYQDRGWEDYLTRGGVCAVEWSERVDDAMPADTLWVDIARGTDESDRIITITGGE